MLLRSELTGNNSGSQFIMKILSCEWKSAAPTYLNFRRNQYILTSLAPMKQVLRHRNYHTIKRVYIVYLCTTDNGQHRQNQLYWGFANRNAEMIGAFCRSTNSCTSVVFSPQSSVSAVNSRFQVFWCNKAKCPLVNLFLLKQVTACQLQ